MPPNARELLSSLVGTTIETLDRGRANDVLRIEGANVIVRTTDSPEGAPVAMRRVQDGLDILFATGGIRITPATFGGYRRSSFIGAVLGTLDGVQASPAPVWVRLDADLQQAHGAHGYPEPAVAADIDEAGMRIAMAAIEGRFPGSEVEEMPHNNPGFDVRILDDDGVAIAYVEVKSTATPDRVFFLSETERRFGERQADRYHLVLVTSVVAEPPSGDVHWHDGPLSDASVRLEPRQWKGVLLA